VRSFLLVGIAVVPILVTCTALGLVVRASRRFSKAELDLINELQRHSDVDDSFYQKVRVAGQAVMDFLENVDQDARPLMGAIELVAQTAQADMSQEYARIMVRILRHGSDRNRANYLEKLLGNIDPPSGQPTEHPRQPNAPVKQPDEPVRPAQPHPNVVQVPRTGMRARGQ
jgi:hypothetical protein